jgi:DNA-directed RNA polymerase subunit K/omega
MEEKKAADTGEGLAAEPNVRMPMNKYEMVMTAAKEAERLNAIYRHRHEKPPKKVTSMALERVYPGLSKMTYDELEPEDNAEQIPFFNPEL